MSSDDKGLASVTHKEHSQRSKITLNYKDSGTHCDLITIVHYSELH